VSNDGPVDEFAQVRGLRFVESRIPALDALTVFVRDGERPHARVQAVLDAMPSRWYPEAGGHRVLVYYEGGDYDRTQFSLKSKAWDHEHCGVCNGRIPSMTLCWVTESGPYFLLCTDCETRMNS
jgi:hypothetical protein